MSRIRGTRAALRDEIIAGHWKPGSYLPSVRKLGERFNVPKSSIHNILKMLQDEGLLQLCPGRGALITQRVADEAALRRFFLRPSDFGTYGYLPIAAGVMNGVFRGAENRNAEVIVSFSDAENFTEVMINDYSRGAVQGIIYCQCRNYDDLIIPLEKANIPYVVAHDEYGSDAVKCTLDYSLIVRQAIDYLVIRGHRRIGFWCGSLEDYIYRKGMKEYLRLIDEYQLEFRQEWLLTNVQSTPSKETEGFFRRKQLPTAVFTMRDYRARLFYEAATAHQLRIPQDISLLSWDNSTWSESASIGLSSYQEPLHELGENAVALLQQWVMSGVRPESRTLPCPLVERGSVIPVCADGG